MKNSLPRFSAPFTALISALLLSTYLTACSNDATSIVNKPDEKTAVSHNTTDGLSQAITSGDVNFVSSATPLINAALTDLAKIKKQNLGKKQIVELSDCMNSKISALLISLRDDNFSFDIKQCNHANNCKVKAFNTEFLTPAKFVKKAVDDLDKQKINIFASEGHNWLKHLVLLADYYRQQASYPMSVVKTSQQEFLRSYFADHIVYTAREINAAQQDMGNFSRSDFSHITPINKTVTIKSRKDFRAAGVYALPGQTFTVTRTDKSNETTYVFINTLRPGATQAFNDDVKKGGKYNRPEFLRSVSYDIEPGETIRLTSPYGGPIQIGFSSSDDVITSFTFTQVGEHAFYNGDTSKNAIAKFNQQLNDNDYDWAEFSTRYFEIHSKTNKMLETLAKREDYKTLTPLTADINQYTHNYLRVQAGYRGDDIDNIDEVHQFAKRHKIAITTWDKVHHLNADQPSCGAGCSGNPYDAKWVFSPTNHGDLHEIGHTIERRELRFKGWETHSSTNSYAFYVKSRLPTTLGYEKKCKAISQQGYFNKLQAAANTANPSAKMAAAKLNNWKDGASISIQTRMAAQKYGELENGWHLLPRQHIILRAFKKALRNKQSWKAQKDKLGFGQFSFGQAKKISQNDWLLVATSYASKLNFTDYYTMWGFGFSATATAQVASFNYKQVPRTFFKFEPQQYCETLDVASVPVDGKQVW